MSLKDLLFGMIFYTYSMICAILAKPKCASVIESGGKQCVERSRCYTADCRAITVNQAERHGCSECKAFSIEVLTCN